MSVNLTELAAARAKMTPGKYVHGQWKNGGTGAKISPSCEFDASITLAGSDQNSFAGEIVGGCGCCGSPRGCHEDIAGLVTTHNAADVLIEIVKTTIERDAATDELNNYLLSDHIDDLTLIRVGRRVDRAKDAYRNALAKVTL